MPRPDNPQCRRHHRHQYLPLLLLLLCFPTSAADAGPFARRGVHDPVAERNLTNAVMAGSFRRAAAPPPSATAASHASAASASEDGSSTGSSGRGGTAGASFELLNRELPHDRRIVAASVHGLREEVAGSGGGSSGGNAVAATSGGRRPLVYGDVQVGDTRPVGSGKGAAAEARRPRKKGHEAAHMLELGRSILWAAGDAAGGGGGGGGG
eukprot:Rhum_TRINITY_DN14717_c41_g1::Rhum_TRINITY_DN14717_c41_g1_i1::g.114153::m.114153